MRGIEFGGVGHITSVGSRGLVSVEEKTRPIVGKYKKLTGPRHLQGYCAIYNTPHRFEGKTDIFTAGFAARSLTGNHAIRFQRSHKNAELLGTTNDRLEIYADEHGIAFRLELPDTDLADQVKTGVQDGTLTGMSTGCIVHDSREVEVKDLGTVRMILDASLLEISCCENGALSEAFVNLIDVSEHKSLEQECRSGELLKTKRKLYVSPLDQYKAAMAELGVTVYGTPKQFQKFD